MADRPAVGDDFTGSTSDGTPAAIAVLATGTVANVANEGDVRQLTSNTNVLSRGWLPVLANHTYRMTMRTRVTVDGTDNRLAAWLAVYASDGTFLATAGGGYVDTAHTVADGWRTDTLTVTTATILAAAATGAFVRARIQGGRNAGATASGATWQVSILRLEDITDIADTNASVVSNTSAIATEAASRAAADTTLTASFTSINTQLASAINKSASFTDNAVASGVPTNWVSWANGSGTRVTGLGGNPYAFKLVSTTNLQSGVRSNLQNGELTKGWYVIEADVTLNAGTFADAMVWLRYYDTDNTTQRNHYVDFDVDATIDGTVPSGSPTTGKLYRWRKLVQISTDVGTNASQGLYAVNHQGTSSPTNDITWHRCAIRAASQAEIEARAATTGLVTTNASVATNAAAIATVDGKLSASYSLTVDGNGRIAQMKLLSNGATSSVKFTAATFTVYDGSSDVPMFELSGGAAYVAGSKVRTESVAVGALTSASDYELDTDINVGSSWVEVANISVTTVDAATRVLLMCSAYIDSSTDGSVMDAQIKRAGSVIWGPKSIAGDPPALDVDQVTEDDIFYIPNFSGMVSFFDTDVPGSANTFSYTLELRVAGSVSNPWVASFRRMFGMVFKR